MKRKDIYSVKARFKISALKYSNKKTNLVKSERQLPCLAGWLSGSPRTLINAGVCKRH